MLRIRRIMDAKGITMKSGADILGIAEKTMYNKVSGATEFTYKEIRTLKAVFPEYDLDYLLSEEPVINP